MSETIVNLNDGAVFDPRGVLAGAWRSFQIRTLDPGAAGSLVSDVVEHAAYVLRGSGAARSGGEEFELTPGMAVTIPKGDGAELLAGSEPLVLFVVTLDA